MKAKTNKRKSEARREITAQMNALGVSFCTTVVSSDLVLDIVNIVFYLFVCRCDLFDGFRNIVCNDDMFFHSVCDRVKFILRIV